jgi:hypothetical protein
MNYEIKSAQTASVREIYYDKNLNKMVFKNDLGIITPLDNTNVPGPQGPIGPTGAQGVQGPIGAQGIPGQVGPAGLNWQGAWSASSSYVVDDAVGYGGASWFCIDPVGPSVTTPDLDPTNWALLAAEGAQGPQGIPGVQGPTGAQGPSGGYTYEIGQYVPSQGGVIFHRYIEAGVQNYLAIPIVNQSTYQVWSNIDATLIGSLAQSTWDGLSNSNAIVNQPGETTSAAAICLNLVTGGKNDWYLPSLDELFILCNNRFNVDKTLSTIGDPVYLYHYWSSTEVDYADPFSPAAPKLAYSINFDMNLSTNNGKSTSLYVRAVRKFSI